MVSQFFSPRGKGDGLFAARLGEDKRRSGKSEREAEGCNGMAHGQVTPGERDGAWRQGIVPKPEGSSAILCRAGGGLSRTGRGSRTAG